VENVGRRMMSRRKRSQVKVLSSLMPGTHSAHWLGCCSAPTCCPMCSLCPCCTETEYIALKRQASKVTATACTSAAAAAGAVVPSLLLLTSTNPGPPPTLPPCLVRLHPGKLPRGTLMTLMPDTHATEPMAVVGGIYNEQSPQPLTHSLSLSLTHTHTHTHTVERAGDRHASGQLPRHGPVCIRHTRPGHHLLLLRLKTPNLTP